MPGVFTLGEWEAGTVIRRFEEMTEMAGEVQEAVLRAILQRNARTEYLDSVCRLHGRTDIAAFKERVPIVTHDQLLPFFQRIANGDTAPLLTADPVTTLSLSSGTTSDGEQKYLILYKEILQASLELIKIGSAYRARDYPVKPGGRALELIFCGKLSASKGGLITGTATTHLFRSEEYKMKQISTKVKSCSPVEVMHGSDSVQSMYCHLVCGLTYWEEVEFINSTFAYTMVEALRLLESQWRVICDDIRHGHLNNWVSDPQVREAIMSCILHTGNPELADLISQKCLKAIENGWHGAISLLWPNCKYLLTIITGSMEHYAKKLQHYAGKVPLVSGDYGATEAWIAVNANPKANPADVSYTVVPSFAYFEFIPLQENKEEVKDEITGQAKTLGLTEVEIGKEYEILITTYGGLYRYRLGDVVKVTGFLNKSPQLAYVCRKNVSLCINIDKNSEADLKRVVHKAARKLKSFKVMTNINGNDRLNGNIGVVNNDGSRNDHNSTMFNGNGYSMINGNDNGHGVINGNHHGMITNGGRHDHSSIINNEYAIINNNGNRVILNGFSYDHNCVMSNGHDNVNGNDNGIITNGSSHDHSINNCNGNSYSSNTNDDAQISYTQSVELVDYTSYADMSTTPGHYVIFWELKVTNGSEEDLHLELLEGSRRFWEECASTMDLEFVDAGYVSSRHIHTIGSLELCIVRAGTFRSLLDRYLAKGTTITQYKTPRCISFSQHLIDILRSSTLSSFFSCAYP